MTRKRFLLPLLVGIGIIILAMIPTFVALASSYIENEFVRIFVSDTGGYTIGTTGVIQAPPLTIISVCYMAIHLVLEQVSLL